MEDGVGINRRQRARLNNWAPHHVENNRLQVEAVSTSSGLFKGREDLSDFISDPGLGIIEGLALDCAAIISGPDIIGEWSVPLVLRATSHDPIEIRDQVRVILDGVPVLDWVACCKTNVGNSVLKHGELLVGDVLPTGPRLIEVDKTAILRLFRMH